MIGVRERFENERREGSERSESYRENQRVSEREKGLRVRERETRVRKI